LKPYKIPTKVFNVKKIPRRKTGKINRSVLIEEYCYN